MERRVVRRKRIKADLLFFMVCLELIISDTLRMTASPLLPKDLLHKSLNGCCPGEDDRLTRAGDVGASDLPILGANAVITRSKPGTGFAW
jgi:hypothetical protein